MAEVRATTIGNVQDVFGVDEPVVQQQPTEVKEEQLSVDPEEIAQAQADSNVDTTNLAQEIDNELGAGTEEIQQPQEQQSEQDPDRVAQLAEQFKDAFGVDLSEALNNYNQLNQVSTEVINTVNAAMGNLALQQQRIEIMSQWATDPQVQQELSQGKTLGEITDTRIQSLQRVYSNLPQATQDKIAKAGAKGIMTLWRSVNKQTQQQRTPVSYQTQNTADTAQVKLSELLAMEEKDFKAKGLPLIAQRNYINDLR